MRVCVFCNVYPAQTVTPHAGNDVCLCCAQSLAPALLPPSVLTPPDERARRIVRAVTSSPLRACWMLWREGRTVVRPRVFFVTMYTRGTQPDDSDGACWAP